MDSCCNHINAMISIWKFITHVQLPIEQTILETNLPERNCHDIRVVCYYFKTFEINRKMWRTWTSCVHEPKQYGDCVPQTTPIEIDRAGPTHLLKPKKRRLHIKDRRKLAILHLPVSSQSWFRQLMPKYTPDRGHRTTSAGQAQASGMILMSQNHITHVLDWIYWGSSSGFHY